LTFEGFHAAACLIERGEPRRFAVPVPLRPDLDAPRLRAAAKKTKDGPQARHLLALAAIYDGATRAEAATIGGVTLPAANALRFGGIVRDWVLKLKACGPEGLIDRKAPGQPSRLTDAHRAAIAAVIESGPVPAVHGVVRWRLVDLCQWLWEEHQVAVSKQTLSRELRAMNYRKLSARPRHHAQADDAVEAFKRASPLAWTRLRAKGPSISGELLGSTPPGSKSGSATRPASARRTN
jgi:transposase